MWEGNGGGVGREESSAKEDKCLLSIQYRFLPNSKFLRSLFIFQSSRPYPCSGRPDEERTNT